MNRFKQISRFHLARDEEPLDPCFNQFPQSISLDEGGKAKFTCKLTGSSPMTGKYSQSLLAFCHISLSLSLLQLNGISTANHLIVNQVDLQSAIPTMNFHLKFLLFY